MKILFLSNKSAFSEKAFGGAESSMRLLAELLSKRGHKVIYFTKDRSGSIYPSIKKVNIDGIDLNTFFSIAGWRQLQPIKILSDWFLKRYITTLIHENDIDIVYCFYELENLEMLLSLKNQGLKIKIVMRMAGLHWYNECLKSPALIKKYELIFNSIDCVNFIQSDLERMVFEKINELEMNVVFKNRLIGDIGSPVNLERKISYRDLKNDHFKIIMATRFTNYQKRQDILVKAISRIDDSIPLEVILIGDGAERSRIQQMIAELNIAHRVRIRPFIDQKKLWNELESTDLLCHACDYEGLGKIIIEAMALGVPVLVSNVAPLNDYIREGENGFLVNNEISEWAGKILNLYYHKELRIKVSEEEILFVKKYYDPQNNICLFEESFKKIIDLKE